MRATITTMRAAAALLACLAFAMSACGGGDANGSARGAEAAELVPPDALAFVSADADLGSDQWRVVRELFGPIGVSSNIPPAVGDELNLALLGIDEAEPEVVALVHSKNEAKLREVAEGFDSEGEHYTVEGIGGWHVVADSPAAFRAVRAAASGRSLADVEAFKQAMAEVEDDAFVTAYADGERLNEVPGEVGALVRIVGSPHWVGASLVAGENALNLNVRTDVTASVYRPRLLREVPSGALLALSFKDGDRLVRRIGAEPSLREGLGEYRALLTELTPAVRGEGILYVQQGALLPAIVLLVESPNPDSAAGALRALARTLKAETNGFLSFNVAVRGNRVLLTNGAGWPVSPTRRLVDDQAFKDALAAADAPEEVTWLAYADIQRLAPIIQALSQLLDSDLQVEKLQRLGTLVAFGGRSGSMSRLEARLTIR